MPLRPPIRDSPKQSAHSAAAGGPLAAAFTAGFAGDHSRRAVTDAGGSLSWYSVVHAVNETARAFQGRERRIGTLDLSGSELLIVMLAAAIVGRSVCTLHGDWSDAELEAALDDAKIDEVISRRTALPGQVSTSAPLGPTEPPASSAVACLLVFDTDEDPLFYVGFTSGSSGRPKPFTRRQSSWTTSFGAAAELFSVSAGTTVVLAGNLQHSHFLFGAMLGWSQGAPVRLYERFDALQLGRDLAEERSAVLYLVPTMLTALDRAEVEPLGDVRAVVVSGAKMERHHWAIAERLFPHAEVAELYGASETSFITVNRRGFVEGDPGYVGMPFPGVDLEIRARENDDADHGLVYIRSTFLFEGYLEDGTVAQSVPPGGFVTVGDIGTLGPDGALSLRGRASNLIITGGKNVHAEEIEIVLVTHSDVAECVVVGAPHAHWGEELVAYFAVEPGSNVAEQELRAFLRPRIAAYKVPKRWFVVGELPRLPNGKIDRQSLRRLASHTAAAS